MTQAQNMTKELVFIVQDDNSGHSKFSIKKCNKNSKLFFFNEPDFFEKFQDLIKK